MFDGKIFQNKFVALFAFIICALATTSAAQKNSMTDDNKLKLNSREVIAKAYELLSRKDSWILNTSSGGTAQPQSKVIARVFLQNYQFEIFDSKGQKVLETIGVGDDSYLLLGGKWEKSKREKDDLAKIRDVFAVPLESIKNSEFVDEEQLDGANTYVYQYDFDMALAIKKSPFRKQSKEFSNIEYKVKIWIDNRNLPLKIESNRKDKSPNGIKTENRVDEFTFDENVKIEVPKI